MTAAPPRRADEITAIVAAQLRALRAARGWSLDELAGRSGVSKGMLVQIEGARSNPSVATLARITDAFGVTVARLLEPAVDRPVHIGGADTAPVLWRGPAGGFGRLLRAASEPGFVELWEWSLEPGERHDSTDHAPGTRELLHVLAGELVVTVAGSDHIAGPGQTVDMRTDRPHAYRNDGTVPARMIMVVLVPPGEYDRRARPAG